MIATATATTSNLTAEAAVELLQLAAIPATVFSTHGRPMVTSAAVAARGLRVGRFGAALSADHRKLIADVLDATYSRDTVTVDDVVATLEAAFEDELAWWIVRNWV